MTRHKAAEPVTLRPAPLGQPSAPPRRRLTPAERAAAEAEREHRLKAAGEFFDSLTRRRPNPALERARAAVAAIPRPPAADPVELADALSAALDRAELRELRRFADRFDRLLRGRAARPRDSVRIIDRLLCTVPELLSAWLDSLGLLADRAERGSEADAWLRCWRAYADVAEVADVRTNCTRKRSKPTRVADLAGALSFRCSELATALRRGDAPAAAWAAMQGAAAYESLRRELEANPKNDPLAMLTESVGIARRVRAAQAAGLGKTAAVRAVAAELVTRPPNVFRALADLADM